MECRISSFLHLNLMISQKYILLVKNILLGKTWSKCVVELSNIASSQMFTCVTCQTRNPGALWVVGVWGSGQAPASS